MTPVALEEIWGRIRPARLTALLERAVREYSPSYAEASALRVFAGALGDAGIPFARQPVPGRESDVERTNLLVELGPRPAHLLWVGHVDTVPLVDERLVCEREGDRLYGLGTADMKGGCAAIVEALLALTESGASLARGLCVGLVVGEEDSGDGAEQLARVMAAPITVIGEPTGLSPCVDHYGYLELRLSARGRRAHAAVPEVGASAIHTMLTWLTGLMDEVGVAPLCDRVAVSVRDIRGGSTRFVVADHCESVLNVHLRPDVDPVEIEALVAGAGEAVGAALRCQVAVERLHWAEGYTDRPDAARLAPLARAFERLGLPFSPEAFRSHSDAPLFCERGAPPVICGPGLLEVAHSRGEYVELSEVERAARLYAAMIYEACIA